MPGRGDGPRIVEVAQGLLRGTQENNGVGVWRAVPYAAPPVGALRFRAPEPPPTWSGVRDAVRFGPICPQPPLAGIAPTEVLEEDCLSVNVWAPPGALSLPVMVWIHGGAYVYGSGSSPYSTGQQLAASGAVVVTINYRLGPWGFLDLSMLSGASGRFDTNLGLRDQVAALAWVRENIAAFGGDPGNVTVFGQSAGGGSVCCLLASPIARGLFHAAIAQSPPAVAVGDRVTAAGVTRAFCALARLPGARFDDVANADPAALLAAAGQLVEQVTADSPGQHAFQPVVDGDVLLADPVTSAEAGHGSGVPLLIGSNEDEGSLFAHPPVPPLIPVAEPTTRAYLRQNHPQVLDAVVAGYAGQGRFGADVSLGGDGVVTIPTLRMAEAHRRRAPVHVYRLRWTTPELMAKRLGTPHGLDVPLVFGNLHTYRFTDLDGDGAAHSLSRLIQSAWLGFARDRVPDVGTTSWPTYDPVEREVLVFDHEVTVERDPDGARRLAWG